MHSMPYGTCRSQCSSMKQSGREPLADLYPFDASVAYGPVRREYDYCRRGQKPDQQRDSYERKQELSIPRMRRVPVALAVEDGLVYPLHSNRDRYVERKTESDRRWPVWHSATPVTTVRFAVFRRADRHLARRSSGPLHSTAAWRILAAVTPSSTSRRIAQPQP